MNLRADQITRLQQELRELLSLSESMHPSGITPSTRTEVHPRPEASPESHASLLQRLAACDDGLYEDLQRLQRTLSRQNFRGAESARRLVRRLAKRARHNAEAARSALASDPGAIDAAHHPASTQD